MQKVVFNDWQCAVCPSHLSANNLLLLVLTDRGKQHTTEADRACNSGAVGHEKHMLFESTALAPLGQKQADLFTPRTVTMRSFFAQQSHLGVLIYVMNCLNFTNI